MCSPSLCPSSRSLAFGWLWVFALDAARPLACGTLVRVYTPDLRPDD